ncbi:MAG: glycosyltransferase, partial [Nitrososphaera sp.]|nr:glycosyltransferase [Nitrososphaera sp.]
VMEENGIDVVNAHHFMSMVYAFYGCKLRRQASLIYTEHSEWELERISRKWSVMGGRLLKHIDHAVGVSPAVTSRLKRVLQVSDEMASTIINGVDVDKFRNSGRNITDIKRRLDIREGEAIIGTVGNLKTIKNHLFLVQAFSELNKVLRNVRLLIIGQGMLGAPDNSEQELTERVRELGITDRVSLLGYRSDIPELVSIMDVFCLTSLKEGLPIGLIEAMAAGLPVVGTNVEGIRDVIVPHEDGLLVELGDVEALKNALIDLLTKPDWSYKLGEAARRKAEEKYSLKRCVSEYEALFLSTSNRSN